MATRRRETSKYSRILEEIFFAHYQEGVRFFEFDREEIRETANQLGIAIPKNFGDLIYSSRYRAGLPSSIRETAPQGRMWIILPAGIARYRFALTALVRITPNPALVQTKVPDSTPGMVDRYALSDEQALLAKVRYNRLVDTFTGVTCYSLQNHLRTTVPGMGQVETDEVYVGVDQRGAQYVFPLQAKGGRDRLGVVQILQDLAMCEHKFPDLICRPIAAQFVEGNLIALFAFEKTETDIAILTEKHYRLVPPEDVNQEDLEDYRRRTFDLPR